MRCRVDISRDLYGLCLLSRHRPKTDQNDCTIGGRCIDVSAGAADALCSEMLAAPALIQLSP